MNSTAISFGYSVYHYDVKVTPRIIVPGTYLVVGVFEHETNAKKFTEHVSELGYTAEYAYYPPSNYYYVYTNSSSSTEKIVEAYWNLRASSEFSDAWVFKAKPKNPSSRSVQKKWPQNEEANADAVENTSVDLATVAVEEAAKAKKKEETNAKGKELAKRDVMHIKFKAHRYENKQQPVSAAIKVVEGARSKGIADLSTNETTDLDKSTITDSVLQVISYAIGYRKVQFDLPLYVSPEESIGEITQFDEDTLVVDIPLVRIKEGDTQIMFNTYFYGNSSVMRERSRYELEELVKLLEEKPEMKIKLHGHTNGNGRGFIYKFSPEEKNFFDLRQSRKYKKNGVGSIKLSALRAETIKSYLEHRGVSANRIETQGWGGKRMLYPEDSPLAKNNIRVEIEVLSE